MQTIKISSQDDLPQVARAIIDALGDRNIVAFFAPMGAGKTTLIREIAARLGSADNVASPTFAIVNRYSIPDGRHINHFDFYRINRPEEVFDIGYEEYFYSDDLCLVEWPEKIEGLIPDDALVVTIEPGEGECRTFFIK